MDNALEVQNKDDKAGQDPERVYDEFYGINYGNIINGSPDYTGNGLFLEHAEAVDPSGFKYKYGVSEDPVEPFVRRDKKMLELISENMPQDKKVRCLELGSGRGGLIRFLAKELIKMDKLEMMIGTNLSQTENEQNITKAKEAGLPDDKFQILKKNFDNLSDYADGSFDVIFSNEAMEHS